MKTVVGVVGPRDLVDIVQAVASEFEEVEVLGLVYEDETEAPEIVAKHEALISVALFTGPVPYYASRHVSRRLPMVYMSLSGSSLYRVLLEFALQGRDMCRISVDTVGKRAIDKLFAALGLDASEVHTIEYHGPITSDELAEFHIEMKNNGARAALTGLRSTYRKLLERGVEVWRVLPDEAAIRDGLSRAVLEGRALRSRDAQLVITLVTVDNLDDVVRTRGSLYAVQRLKLDLQRLLLEYAEKLEASLHLLGDDEFMLVSTRRMVEAATGYWTRSPLLDSITKQMPLKISIGMGLGLTAAVAQTSARIAVHYARGKGSNCAYAVEDSRKVIGPIGAGASLEYSLRTEDAFSRTIAEKTGFSIATVTRLQAFMTARNFEPITAGELAAGLGVTSRSGRRIIARLVACGLAEQAGEEQPYRRGRPRQTYRLKLQQLR